MAKNSHKKLNTVPIRKKLRSLGFEKFQVEFNIQTSAFPRKHHRVTAWHSWLLHEDRAGTYAWVIGDGYTLQSAWRALLYHAQNNNYGFAGGKKPSCRA